MSKKKIIFSIVCILITVLFDAFILTYRSEAEADSVKLYMDMKADTEIGVQMLYTDEKDFSEELSNTAVYTVDKDSDEPTTIALDVPLGYEKYRIDFGNTKATVELSNIHFVYDYKNVLIDTAWFTDNLGTSDISSINVGTTVMTIETEDGDPYILLNVNSQDILNTLTQRHHEFQKMMGIILSVCATLLCLLVLRYFWDVLDIVKEIIHSKKMILNLAKNDFKTRFAGSYLGIIWAFVQPIVTIVVYWFVFQVGFRSSPIDNFPFVLWLSTGLIPWFFFSESWNGGTSSMIEYSYLVKKVVFKISILPIVKIISALFVHLFFVAFIMLFYVFYGYYPDWAWVQVLYYSFCMCMLVVGLSYFTCAIMVFFRDTSQIISIILQVGNWVTPIMWSYTMLSPKLQWIMYLNPMFYVVQGYRTALINHKWFFEMPYQTAGFWIFVIALIGFGMLIFNKLKVHFADVL